MEFVRVDYKYLNAKQKENYNYAKVASALADYGYDSMRLNNDWEGADFIALRGDDMLRVQLKGRFTIDKKYLGKDIKIAFIENQQVKIYDHDEVVNSLPEKIVNSKNWTNQGTYSWSQTPKIYDDLIVLI